MESINILVTGVGGQGTILASDVLASVGLLAGYDVKKSEVHGMAQRGGSVTSHVRWGQKVYSPIIGCGEVDFLLAFEKLEAIRYVETVRPGCGVIIVNDQRIPPLSVNIGDEIYPDDDRLLHILHQVSSNVHVVPAIAVAEELGNARVLNVVMLGTLSTLLDIPEDTWVTAIQQHVPRKLLEINTKAFQAGRGIPLIRT
ncbi:MAG: indolepyruvate oxidoreductase subunit beta [Chloroflexi bacterium]|nr:indolepyruvate oxidoreductase subunit beta [Chloroflexota bacterium]